MTVWKSNPRRLTPWTRQYFSGSPNSLVDVYAGKDEIVKACASDKEVIHFLSNCGEENLQFLLEPKRLDRALNALDTSQDGEVDVDEWCVVSVRKEIPPGRHRCDKRAHRSFDHAGRRRSSAA